MIREAPSQTAAPGSLCDTASRRSWAQRTDDNHATRGVYCLCYQGCIFYMLPGWILNMLPRGIWQILCATKSGYCICYQGWILYIPQGCILYMNFLPGLYILYATSGVYSICYQDVYSVVSRGIAMLICQWGFTL